MHYHYKSYRKKHNFRQQDIGFLMNTTRSSFAKFESGFKKPTLDLILTYHLLFDLPLHNLLKDYLVDFTNKLEKRVETLIRVLQEDVSNTDIQDRIEQLQSIIERIGCLKEIYDQPTQTNEPQSYPFHLSQ